jgi:hypothetical protein
MPADAKPPQPPVPEPTSPAQEESHT